MNQKTHELIQALKQVEEDAECYRSYLERPDEAALDPGCTEIARDNLADAIKAIQEKMQ